MYCLLKNKELREEYHNEILLKIYTSWEVNTWYFSYLPNTYIEDNEIGTQDHFSTKQNLNKHVL